MDPKVTEGEKVSVKFQKPGLYDKVHYYGVYLYVKLSSKKEDPEVPVLVARESSVEWLEIYMLCVSKKLNKLI